MEIVPSNSLQTLIYVVAPSQMPHSLTNSLLPQGSRPFEHHHIMVWSVGATTWVLTDTDHINHNILECSDACLLIIDGNIGVSPQIIDAFREAQDASIPVCIGVHNSITGRADFDEVYAVVQRVMDEDALARYLPIESDEGEGIAGLFDLLTTDLHVLEDQHVTVRQSDPEHVSLTVDKRADLIEILAHLGLSDEQLSSMSAGNPVSIPALENAYSQSDFTKVIPLDAGVSRNVLVQWQDSLHPRWLPVVVNTDDIRSIDEVTFTIGLGIDKDLARVWNADRATWLERMTPKGSISDAIDCTIRGGFMWATGVSQNDTIRPAESQATVTRPNY